MSIYVDGNFAAAFRTSNVVTYPFTWPNNGDTRQYELEYIQYANAYTDAAFGSTSGDAPSAYLVEQGPVTKIGAGLVRFRRVYCEVPTNWSETQQVAYTFPGLSGPNSDPNSWSPYYYRSAVTLYKIATVYHNYSQGNSSPTLDNTFQVTDNGNVVDYIGIQNPNFGVGLTSPNIEPTTYNVSSDSQQIKATIWEKVTVTVPKPV